MQVVLRTGLLGSLPRTVGSTNVLRLATGLDLVTNLSKLAIDDTKREGLPVCSVHSIACCLPCPSFPSVELARMFLSKLNLKLARSLLGAC